MSERNTPTPGPWTNREHSTFVHSKHGNICACGDPHASQFVGYTECEIDSDGLSEAVANAAFIAHTENCHNDMLAALKKAEEWLSGWASAEPYIGEIRAAINKAEARYDRS